MKNVFRVFLSLTLVLLSLTGFAGDPFFVIHLKGTVSNKTTGKVLKIGDQISEEDQLKFSAADAIVVIMGSKGKFTLSPSIKGSNQSGELVAYVNNALLPLKSNGHLSTRAGETESILDLKGYLGTGTFYILGDELDLKIDSIKYPVSEKEFFIYRYVNSGNVVSKKIESRGSHIIIHRQALYTVNGTAVDPATIDNVDLYFYSSPNKNSRKIVSFTPRFMDEEQLKEELAVQQQILQNHNHSKEQIEKELYSFVIDVYGRTDETKFRQWFQKNMGRK